MQRFFNSNLHRGETVFCAKWRESAGAPLTTAAKVGLEETAKVVKCTWLCSGTEEVLPAVAAAETVVDKDAGFSEKVERRANMEVYEKVTMYSQ